MKKFKIVGFLLILTLTSVVLEGCFKKGEEDPFISFRSRKARLSGEWTINVFTGDYFVKFNSGENREIDFHQTDKTTISEYTTYIDMTSATQDSLHAGQDTSIEWKGRVIEGKYIFREDGTFDYAYEYTLEKTISKYFEEGSDSVGIFAPVSDPFRIDSTLTRNYRTELRGRWNFLYNVDGYKKKERIVLEVENATYLTNYAVTYVYDFDDDDLEGVGDTSFSTQTLESVSHKYANGEYNLLWEIDMLKNLETKWSRTLDHIYTHALTGSEGYKHTHKGTELIEMAQEQE